MKTDQDVRAGTGRVQRLAYHCLAYLGVPLLAGRLLWGGLRDRRYWRRWPERFGWPEAPYPPGQAVLWAHTVSVGEFHAAVPLLRRLEAAFPAYRLLITTVTPTGAERVPAEFGEHARHLYLPYDLRSAVGRFLARVRPRIGLVLETELWPELFTACRQRGIPLCLLNARLSRRSAARYRPVAGLMRHTLGALSLVAARGEADARHLVALGVDPAVVHVTGNLKYDLEIPDAVPMQGRALRDRLLGGGPAWIAASTHPGEEEQVLRAHAEVVRAVPDTRLVLAPRHPQRAPAVRGLCRRAGRPAVLRGGGAPCPAGGVLVLDALGELLPFYAACDAAFVGGSLVPRGGHNLLEPAALGRPVLTGPRLHNFREAADMLCSGGGARIISSPQELTAAVLELLQREDVRCARGRRAARVVEKNRGAAARVEGLLRPYLRAGLGID